MKPDWDKLADTFKESATVVIADVDCTAEGKDLCERFGVEGFPTIKYFNPPDEEGEDYEGGRGYDELLAFAETLGPGCSPSTKDKCTAEQLSEMEAVLAMPDAEREAELTKLVADLKAMEKAHDELLESLQAQYEKSNEEVEAKKKLSKPRIKLLKMAGTKLTEPVPSKEEL